MDDTRYKRCRLVRDLLNNPLMNETMATVNVDLINELLATPSEDKQKREDIYFESKALFRVIGRLQSFANEATMEEDKVSKQQPQLRPRIIPGAN